MRMSMMYVTMALLLALAGVSAAAGRDVKLGSTAENLMAASQTEMQTNARYLAFSQKADEDGYHQVAVMFRAIARAEAIHASRLAALAGQDTPTAVNVQAVSVGSTRQNLEQSLAGEKFDHGELYPEYMRQAKKDKNDEAFTLFEHIMKAEDSHRVWYKQVLKEMNSYTAEGAQFYVCPDCGTVSRSPKHVCPSCSAPRQRFEKVT